MMMVVVMIPVDVAARVRLPRPQRIHDDVDVNVGKGDRWWAKYIRFTTT